MYSLSGSASHIEASKVDMFQTVWKTYSQPPLYDWDHLLEGDSLTLKEKKNLVHPLELRVKHFWSVSFQI